MHGQNKHSTTVSNISLQSSMIMQQLLNYSETWMCKWHQTSWQQCSNFRREWVAYHSQNMHSHPRTQTTIHQTSHSCSQCNTATPHKHLKCNPGTWPPLDFVTQITTHPNHTINPMRAIVAKMDQGATITGTEVIMPVQAELEPSRQTLIEVDVFTVSRCT